MKVLEGFWYIHFSARSIIALFITTCMQFSCISNCFRTFICCRLMHGVVVENRSSSRASGVSEDCADMKLSQYDSKIFWFLQRSSSFKDGCDWEELLLFWLSGKRQGYMWWCITASPVVDERIVMARVPQLVRLGYTICLSCECGRVLMAYVRVVSYQAFE